MRSTRSFHRLLWAGGGIGLLLKDIKFLGTREKS